MKRAYAKSQYAKPYERCCRERYPQEAAAIFQKADEKYREFLTQMPDVGENLMAKNLLDWFTILAFYEASDHRLDGEALLEIKRRAAERLKFLGALVNGNRTTRAHRLFEKTYVNYNRMVKEYQARGEWRDAWQVELNPDHRTEGFCFHLIGCPIAKHAREHGYEALLPYLCKTDHYLAEVMHTRLIRTQTEALGGEYCGYFITGNKE